MVSSAGIPWCSLNVGFPQRHPPGSKRVLLIAGMLSIKIHVSNTARSLTAEHETVHDEDFPEPLLLPCEVIISLPLEMLVRSS